MTNEKGTAMPPTSEGGTVRTEQDFRSISVYLSSLDDSLMAEGIDPKVRLDHVEEVADMVLTSGVDPEDEFGSAQVYAERLATSLQVKRRQPWLRALMWGLGFYFVQVGLLGIDTLQRRWRWDLLDVPFEVPLVGLWMSAIVGLSFWVTVSPIGVRFNHRVYRLPVVGQVAVLLLAIVGMVGGAVIGWNFGLDSLLTVAISWPLAIVLAISAVIGLAMCWWSGAPRFFWALITSNSRSRSFISYNPFAFQRVKVKEPVNLSPNR